MINTVFRDALKPIAARLPKIVREHEILRVAGTLLGKDHKKSVEAARNEVLKWAQKRSGGRLPPEAWKFDAFEYFSGGRNSSCVHIESPQSDIWAIRADDPDRTVAERVWTTEVVVGLSPGKQPQFSARLLVSTPEAELDIEPHTPGFVQQVAESCGLTRGAYDLRSDPWTIESADDADALIEMLTNERRQLPVFVLTIPRGADRPLLDATVLSRAMLGIGHVAILPPAFAWVLTERFGSQRSVFGGAVRAYLPGFSEDTNPYNHRLVLADHISSDSGAAQCARWIRTLAATESVRRTRLGEEVLAFSAIRNASLILKQQQLEQDGASDFELLDTAKARINALEKQTEDEKASLEYFAAEHDKAEERAQAAEEQARASAFRIQQLLDQLKARGEAPDVNIKLPTSWGEFSDWCDSNLAGRVVLAPTARRGVRAPEFEDYEQAARCLLWLANNCRDRRLNGGDGTLREEPVEDGIRNAHCGSDEFDLDWQGRRYTADWHIKGGGNTRDPKRCLRIYYFWDPNTQQIVVADLPAHRRTGAS